MSKLNRKIIESKDWPHSEPPEGYVRVDSGPGEYYFIRENAIDTSKKKRKDKPVGEKKQNKNLLDMIVGRKSWKD